MATKAMTPDRVEFPATVLSGGKVTLPINLRKALGTSAGTKLRFVFDGKTIRVMVKSPQPAPDSKNTSTGRSDVK